MEWIAGVLIFVLLVMAVQRHRSATQAKKQQHILRKSVAERESVALAKTAIRRRDEALKLPPFSAARAEAIEQGKKELQLAAKLASEIAAPLAGYEALLSDLEALASSKDRWISPPSQRVPAEGTVVVAFIDTETTGLGDLDEPITLGIVLATVALPKGHLQGDFEQLYEMRKPHVPIHPRARAVHGLSMDDLEGKSFDMPKIRGMIERAHVLVAHNANFDRKMLTKLLPEVTNWPWRCSYRQASWPKGLENKKLDTICAHFSIARAEPHNALSDARAMAECLLQQTGKTARSRTYLAACLTMPNF